MFKPLTRTAKSLPRPAAGFAETQFLHHADDEDYSGFAPTQLVDDHADDAERPPAAPATNPDHARAAAATSRSALERAAAGPRAAPEAAGEPTIPPSWVTSQWVAAQEAKAHEAASQTRAVIAAQRHAQEQAEGAPASVPRTGLGRLRAAFEKLLPGEFRSLLPLCIGVTVTMALISAMLPVFDKP